MSSPYKVGDLVIYRTMYGSVVKGKVTAVYSDLDGPVVVWRVTAKMNNIFPWGIEQVTRVDSPYLKKRERYNHVKL